MATSEMFFISTSTSMARSRSVRTGSSWASGAAPSAGAPASARSSAIPAAAPLQEQHVARHQDQVALDLGDPVAVASDGHDAHAHLHRQLQVRQPPVGHLGVLPDADPVGDLLGGGQVGDEGPGDPEAVGDDAGDVDGGVAQALDHGLRAR